MTATVRDGRPAGRTWWGHPVGLVNLFGVELWERFSFYGMTGILIYYLYYSLAQGGLGVARPVATSVAGAYGGLVYLATVLGGWVADRVLGMERTVLYGGVVVMAGHIALAVLPGLTGVGVGLVLVALGSGGLKANASSLLGTFYAEDDPRAAGGFTLFYLGINLGAFLGPLLTGLLQSRIGFHVGFGAVAVGMAIGLAQYVIMRGNLAGHGREVPNPLPRGAIRWLLVLIMAVVGVIVGVMELGWVTMANLSWVTTGVIAAAALAYFRVLWASSKVTPIERRRVGAFVPLFFANAVFWSLFQQIFTVLSVYSDKRMNWSIFGWHAPPSWVQSVEPVWVIVLSPLFAALWTRLGRRAPTTPRKFSYGVAGVGVAFLLFVPLAGFGGASVPALLVAVVLGVFCMSELLLSPTGLAVTTSLAPQAFRSQMMALYFLSVGIGTAMAGSLSRYYTPQHEVAYFGITGLVAIAVGFLVAVSAPRVHALMSGVH